MHPKAEDDKRSCPTCAFTTFTEFSYHSQTNMGDKLQGLSPLRRFCVSGLKRSLENKVVWLEFPKSRSQTDWFRMDDKERQEA